MGFDEVYIIIDEINDILKDAEDVGGGNVLSILEDIEGRVELLYDKVNAIEDRLNEFIDDIK